MEKQESKETKPLTSKHGSAAAVGDSTDGTGSRRNSVHERRLYRPGSFSSQLALGGGSSVALGSLGASGSRGNISVRSRTPSGKSVVSRVVSRAEYQRDLKPSLSQGLNRNLLFMSFMIVMTTSYQFGYNIGVLNQPVALIQQFYNETNSDRVTVEYNDNGTMVTMQTMVPMDDYQLTFLWSLTTTLFVIGGMIGAYVAGFVANKIGRKKAVLISCIPAFIGAVLSFCCKIAGSVALLLVGRFVTGVNCGLATQLAPMYLLEIVPFNLKGAFGTAHQLFVTIGIFFSAILGLREILGTESGWPYLLLLNALPALLCVIVFPFLPDSPRYLLLVRKNRDAAEKALIFLRRTDDVSADIEEMETEMQDSGESAPKDSDTEHGTADERKNLSNGTNKHQAAADDEFTMMKLLKSRELRMPLLVAVFLQVIQQLSGINAIFFYSTGIYQNAGVPAYNIQYAVLVTNAVNVIMTIVAVPVMDKAGRRPLLLIPMVTMVLILALITIALKLQSEIQWMSYISIGCVLAYVISFAIGLGPIPTMVGAELFRQGPRPFVMSLAGLTNWIFTAIVAISFEMIQKLTKEYTFLIFLVLMIGFTIFVYFLVPETKNKTFEEIASMWQPGDKIEVEEVVDDPIYNDTDLAAANLDDDRNASASGLHNGVAKQWEPEDGKAAVFAADVVVKMPDDSADVKKAPLETSHMPVKS